MEKENNKIRHMEYCLMEWQGPRNTHGTEQL